MKAANIPEFVNIDYNNWHSIKDGFTKTENYASTVAEFDYDTKDINSIVKEAENKIAEYPNDYHGYYLKAVMLSEKGDKAKAIINAQYCIKMIEGMTDKGFKGYGDLGLVYFIANNLTKAISISRKSLELNPKHLFAWMTLGDIYYQQRDYENTNQVYSEIIKFNNNVDYRLKRAQLKMGVKSLYKEAINDLEIIINSEDCHVVTLQMLVTCYSVLKDMENAEKLSSKLIGCDPHIGYFSRANNYFQVGKYQKAVDDFSEGLKYNKDDLRATFLRGQALFELKEYQNALIDFQKVKQLSSMIPASQLSIDPERTDEIIARCKQLARVE